MKKEITVNECKRVLEAAGGEVEAIIPDEVLEATIRYLDEYKRLALAESYRIERTAPPRGWW